MKTQSAWMGEMMELLCSPLKAPVVQDIKLKSKKSKAGLHKTVHRKYIPEFYVCL